MFLQVMAPFNGITLRVECGNRQWSTSFVSYSGPQVVDRLGLLAQIGDHRRHLTLRIRSFAARPYQLASASLDISQIVFCEVDATMVLCATFAVIISGPVMRFTLQFVLRVVQIQE